MTAFYIAVAFQIGWMIIGQALGFDPYPYLFLLFLSSLTQLLLMFVIMVGQQVIGRTADKRAVQTYVDAEAVLHACETPASSPARAGPGHPPRRRAHGAVPAQPAGVAAAFRLREFTRAWPRMRKIAAHNRLWTDMLHFRTYHHSGIG